MTDYQVRFRLLTETARVPTKAHASDAAFDLYAYEQAVVHHKGFETIGVGVALDLPPDLCALVLSRSGLAAKRGVFVLNSPGLIDPGYQGEVRVILFNSSNDPFPINAGDRIAQLMFSRLERVDLIEAFSVLPTDRGTKGLGSTGLGDIRLLQEGDDDVPVAPA